MSTGVVVDASACGAWVLRDEETARSRRLLECVRTGQLRLVVSDLWWYEILSALRMAVARARIQESEARRGLAVLAAIPKDVFTAEAQGQEGILSVAFDTGLSAYDATHLALARSRGLDLVSADTHLLRLRPRFPCIHSVEDFCAQLNEA